MSIKKFGLIFLLIALVFSSSAGNYPIDTIIMKEVVISSSRLKNFAVGASVQAIDSLSLLSYSMQSFGELLENKTPIIIKSYGPGGVSTSSIRGGGSSHTAVIWNGINIQSPANGQINLSLLPAGMLDEVHIQYGGSGTLYGSGAVAGVIHIGTKKLLNSPDYLKLSIGTGSYNHKSMLFGVKLGNDKIAGSIRAFTKSAKNDFSFQNAAKYGKPLEIQTNAAVKQNGLIGELMTSTGKLSELKTAIWVQFNDSEVQTLMTSSSANQANQKDYNLKTALNWNHIGSNASFYIRSVFLRDQLSYYNPELTPAISENKANSWLNEIESKWVVRDNHIANLGLSYTFEDVGSDGYDQTHQRNRAAFFGSYKISQILNKITWVNSFRQEIVDNLLIPFVFSSGLNMNLNDVININANFSKNYRLPNFNDLYWQKTAFTEGNPDLMPESGISADIGITQLYKSKDYFLKVKENIFLTKIKDWIIWLPNEAGIWTPDNKNSGRNYGLEITTQAGYGFPNGEIKLNMGYTLINSQISDIEDTQFSNKPLIYVPKHHLLVGLTIFWRKFGIDYNHQFSTKRYYDYINTLDAYHIGNINLSYAFPLNNHRINIALKIKNIWNEDYQVMAWYAMPGRNYFLSLNYELFK